MKFSHRYIKCRKEEELEGAVWHGGKQDCNYAKNEGKGALFMHGKVYHMRGVAS